VVERVDESLKADIMHWAAIYVRGIGLFASVFWLYVIETGGSNAPGKQENIPSGSVGDQGNEFVQGTLWISVSW
jgi:hypothetical protein